jgi:Effector-associated domain 11
MEAMETSSKESALFQNLKTFMANQSRIYHITTEFLDALRTEKRLMGVDKHVQIQTILSQLSEETDVDTLKLTLIPLIAQSPQEQAHLYGVFDQAVKRVEEIESIRTVDENNATTPTTASNFPKVFNFWKVAAMAAVLILLLLIGGNKLWQSNQKPPIETPQQVDSTQISPNDTLAATQNTLNTERSEPSYFVDNKPYPFPDHLEKYSLKPPSPTQEWLSNNWTWLRWLLALAWMGILLGIWQYLVAKRRKLVAKHGTNEKPPYIWNINIEGIEPVVMDTHLDRVTQMLRNRALSETQRLDMERTVNATIEQGGLPTFKYKHATRPTDYLLLIDRQSVRNHRAKLFDTLYEVFKAQEIEIARFFFDSDVRTCYSEDYPHGIPLADIQQKYYQSRLLIVGTGGQLLNPMSGKAAAWTSVFNQWKDRALFSPKPLTSWGYDERQLSALFTTLPATLQGLGFWVEEVNTGADARFDNWEDKIDDVPNAPILPDDHDPLPILDLYFEPNIVKWIAACAIYPTLHWDLTLWLGQEVQRNAIPLYSPHVERNSIPFHSLMQICRLSWFVNGEMPDETRTALLHYLEQNDAPLLLHLRAAIAEELQRNPPPTDSVAYDKFRLNIALNEWLATTDAQKKKELEAEVARLLAQGAEPDFTVLKYLHTPRTALDFIVPEAWKKLVHPSGFAALGWLKGWKDLVWVLALLVLGLIGVFYPYAFKTFDCSKDRIVQLTVRDTMYYFCLDNPLSALTYHEQLLHKMGQHDVSDSISTNLSESLDNSDALSIDSVLTAILRIEAKDGQQTPVRSLLKECRKNIAVDYYREAAYAYGKGLEGNSCILLDIAEKLDSLDDDIKVAQAFLCGKVDKKARFDIAPIIRGDVIALPASSPLIIKPLTDVKITGAGVNTHTDAKGNYILKLPPQYPSPAIALTFTKSGYKTVNKTFTIDKVKQLPTVQSTIPYQRPQEKVDRTMEKLLNTVLNIILFFVFMLVISAMFVDIKKQLLPDTDLVEVLKTKIRNIRQQLLSYKDYFSTQTQEVDRSKKNINSLKSMLLNLIAEGKTKQVVNKLRELNLADTDLNAEVVQLSARFSQYERQVRMGMEDPSILRMELNKINNALLFVINRLEKNDTVISETASTSIIWTVGRDIKTWIAVLAGLAGILIFYFKFCNFNNSGNYTNVAIYVTDKNEELIPLMSKEGYVTMRTGREIKKESIDDRGTANFQNVKVGDKVRLNVDFSEPYRSQNPDSIYTIPDDGRIRLRETF